MYYRKVVEIKAVMVEEAPMYLRLKKTSCLSSITR